MSKKSSTIRAMDTTAWFNLALFGIVSALVFYYVITANSVTARSYKIQNLRDKIESLVEINSSLMSEKIAIEDQASLLEFAKAQSFVEAKNIVHIFENKSVALRR